MKEMGQRETIYYTGNAMCSESKFMTGLEWHGTILSFRILIFLLPFHKKKYI